ERCGTPTASSRGRLDCAAYLVPGDGLNRVWVPFFGIRGARTMKTALLLFMALAALAAQGQDLAGHYVLRGVREVGSEMMLKPDGSFEFMLAYGAADYWAKGTWRQEGNTVVLQSAGK